MKTISALTLAVIVWAEVSFTSSAAPAISEPNRTQKQMRYLDNLERIFLSGGFGSEKLWRESNLVANRLGPSVIHTIMLRSRSWEIGSPIGLAFVPLVDLLPRGETIGLLTKYQRSSRASDRLWSEEFMKEFALEDTDWLVRKYSAKP